MTAGRVAIVTGASRGIGRSTALALAGQGLHVVAVARSREDLDAVVAEVRAAGGEASAAVADVGDQAQVERMVASVLEGHGGVDVLVAASGVTGPTRPAWEVSPEEWRETIEVNLTGVFLCCRAVLPAMMARRRGSIVVIGSVTGKRPLAARTPYAASKLGLVGFVRTLAVDAGRYGVRANVISPGPTGGERLDAVLAEQARLSGRPREDVEREMLAQMPLGRLVDPGEVADCAVFLASERAAAITGEDVNVAAGLAA